MELILLLIIVVLWVSLKEKTDEVNDIKFPNIKKYSAELKEKREQKREELRKKKELEKKELAQYDFGNGISPKLIKKTVEKVLKEMNPQPKEEEQQDKYVKELNQNLAKIKENLAKSSPKISEEVTTHTKEVVYYLDGKPHKYVANKFIPLDDDKNT
jgi:hypothetical protein